MSETTTIKTLVFRFRYEHVNSTRKFTVVAEIVSLLRKIYKRDAPFRAVFEVKTLAVLFPPYLHEMKKNTRNLNLPPFWRLFVSMEMVQLIPTRALSRARGLSMSTHLTAVWDRGRDSWCLPKGGRPLGTRMYNPANVVSVDCITS